MITQAPINKPSGTQSKDCDPGLPISGRTSTGQYQILQVNSDGTLPISGSEVPLPDATTAYMTQAQMIAFPPGAFAGGTFLTISGINSVAITAGLYRVNPFLMFAGTAGGSINLAIATGGSNLSNYANTLNPFVDAFNPTVADFYSGLGGFWHNNPVQSVGGSANTPYNRSNALIVYLPAGTYNLIAWVDTAINSIGAVGYAGVIEFTKVG